MPRGRSQTASTIFLIVWATFWTSAILIATWTLGAAALAGEPAAALFLLVWVGFAGFGLVLVGRRLRRRLLDQPPPPRQRRNHSWRDGIDPPEPPAGS
jgi:hypothetical protein